MGSGNIASDGIYRLPAKPSLLLIISHERATRQGIETTLQVSETLLGEWARLGAYMAHLKES